MITIFENFENNYESEPQIGDWVICDAPSYVDKDLKIFLADKIGKLIKKQTVNYIDDGDIIKNNMVLIEYPNLPKSYTRRYNNTRLRELPIIENSIWLNYYYITFFDKDKTNLEAILATKEYNL